jgi:hypothetical protein
VAAPLAKSAVPATFGGNDSRIMHKDHERACCAAARGAGRRSAPSLPPRFMGRFEKVIDAEEFLSDAARWRRDERFNPQKHKSNRRKTNLMKKFLEICSELGLDNVSERAPKLKASIPALQSENVLFFICGSDFILNPSDTKFRGIVNLFINREGSFELNLYPECISAFNSMLSSPSIKASMEGTSAGNISGDQVTYSAAKMVKGPGVRDGGAANYNLQTKALEIVVTHRHGLDKDGALEPQVIQKLKTAFAAPAKPLSGLGQATLSKMREELTPYWGGDIRRLGL